MSRKSKEADILLTIQALQGPRKLSCRKAAKTFNVPKSTLRARLHGRDERATCRPNSAKFTETEEETLVQYIIDLDSRGFPPRLYSVTDIADRVLEIRDGGRVGKL